MNTPRQNKSYSETKKCPPFWTVYNSGLSVDTPKNCTPAEDSLKGF